MFLWTVLILLLSRNANPGNCTVTMCHSRTKNLAELTRSADILIAAIGKPHFVTANMVKPGAVVIDVGINRIPDASKKSGSRLTGDVAMHEFSEDWKGHITPVPGGVGPRPAPQHSDFGLYETVCSRAARRLDGRVYTHS